MRTLKRRFLRSGRQITYLSCLAFSAFLIDILLSAKVWPDHVIHAAENTDVLALGLVYDDPKQNHDYPSHTIK